MFERWCKRRQARTEEAQSSDAEGARSPSEDNVLVEYSEFVLVLSPEPLWPRWKNTDTTPSEE